MCGLVVLIAEFHRIILLICPLGGYITIISINIYSQRNNSPSEYFKLAKNVRKKEKKENYNIPTEILFFSIAYKILSSITLHFYRSFQLLAENL